MSGPNTFCFDPPEETMSGVNGGSTNRTHATLEDRHDHDDGQEYQEPPAPISPRFAFWPAGFPVCHEAQFARNTANVQPLETPAESSP